MNLTSAPPIRAGTLIAMNTASAGGAVAQAITAALTELRLPDDIFTLLEPVFEAAGWSLEHASIEDPFDGQALQLTVARRGEDTRYLVHFDSPDGSSALKQYSPQNKHLVSEVWERLSAHSDGAGNLYVVYRVKPHPAFTLLMKKRWAKVYGLDTEQVALEDIEQLIDTPALLQEQLEDSLDLVREDSGTASDDATEPRKRPAREMRRLELQRLADILGEGSWFLRSEDRKALLESAGLGDQAAQFDLEGAAAKVAPPLIYGLDNPSLGSLLQALTLQDVDPRDAAFVESLLDRYSFATETEAHG